MSIKFAAIVDAQDAPVYFRSAESTPEDVAVNHQFIAEMTLDFVEQQAARIQANLTTPVLALVHDGVAVYATLSNTRTKYLVGIDSLREPQDLGSVMAALQDAYIGYLCNPFCTSTSKMIQSPHFDRKIDRIFRAGESSTASVDRGEGTSSDVASVSAEPVGA